MDSKLKVVHFDQCKHSFIFVKVQNSIEVYDTLNIFQVKVSIVSQS